MLNCPKCGEDNVDGSVTCETCGYKFRSAAQAAFDAPAKPAPSSPYFGWGCISILFGFIAMFVSTQVQTTAPYSDTLNIGLLQNQEMVFHAGLALFIVGAILMAAHGIIVAVLKSR